MFSPAHIWPGYGALGLIIISLNVLFSSIITYLSCVLGLAILRFLLYIVDEIKKNFQRHVIKFRMFSLTFIDVKK